MTYLKIHHQKKSRGRYTVLKPGAFLKWKQSNKNNFVWVYVFAYYLLFVYRNETINTIQLTYSMIKSTIHIKLNIEIGI